MLENVLVRCEIEGIISTRIPNILGPQKGTSSKLEAPSIGEPTSR